MWYSSRERVFIVQIFLKVPVLSSTAWPALLYFCTLSHKWHDFRGKIFECKVCVVIFCTNLSETFLTLKKNSSRYYHKCTRSSCKVGTLHEDRVPLFFSHFNKAFTNALINLIGQNEVEVFFKYILRATNFFKPSAYFT